MPREFSSGKPRERFHPVKLPYIWKHRQSRDRVKSVCAAKSFSARHFGAVLFGVEEESCDDRRDTCAKRRVDTGSPSRARSRPDGADRRNRCGQNRLAFGIEAPLRRAGRCGVCEGGCGVSARRGQAVLRRRSRWGGRIPQGRIGWALARFHQRGDGERGRAGCPGRFDG